MVTIREKDVELYRSASNGFKGFFDEDGTDISFSKSATADEDYREAYEWSDSWLDKIYKAKTLEDLIKGIPSKVPYSLEMKEDAIYFYWSCPNGLNGEYTFGYDIIYGEIN